MHQHKSATSCRRILHSRWSPAATRVTSEGPSASMIDTRPPDRRGSAEDATVASACIAQQRAGTSRRQVAEDLEKARGDRRHQPTYAGLGEAENCCSGDGLADGMLLKSPPETKVPEPDEVEEVKPLENELLPPVASEPEPELLVDEKAPAFRSMALPSSDSGSTRA
jgi:hypothetical protein